MDACILLCVALTYNAALDTRSQGHDANLCEQLLLLLGAEEVVYVIGKHLLLVPFTQSMLAGPYTQHLDSMVIGMQDPHYLVRQTQILRKMLHRVRYEYEVFLAARERPSHTSQDTRWQQRKETGKFLAWMKNEPHARSLAGILFLPDAHLARTAERFFLVCVDGPTSSASMYLAKSLRACAPTCSQCVYPLQDNQDAPVLAARHFLNEHRTGVLPSTLTMKPCTPVYAYIHKLLVHVVEKGTSASTFPRSPASCDVALQLHTRAKDTQEHTASPYTGFRSKPCGHCCCCGKGGVRPSRNGGARLKIVLIDQQHHQRTGFCFIHAYRCGSRFCG